MRGQRYREPHSRWKSRSRTIIFESCGQPPLPNVGIKDCATILLVEPDALV
jgi:hypothetical protein